MVVQGENENEMKCEMLSSWDHNAPFTTMPVNWYEKNPPPFSPVKRPGIRFKHEVEMSNANKVS